ncbi:Succinate dehydrogenase assembly factor 2, mitochondrial [Strongyloides ratti]|uniref:Succinate dehydrogenase assembly factor 2, mitochondrial n=1 Tax=Strongyloides ratti TaxID=34506 RepID=A0A090L772_STRRB|nr:Succinate dehydrogenase assembly factor 2, mitochondrial [Strongyloides ratti]CEF65626.1 Succinate dehydrogenase assembly factor 2, mitochondrial [Strongyloides ratti]
MTLLNVIKTITKSFHIPSKRNIHLTVLRNAVSIDLKEKIIYKETDIQKWRARLYYQSFASKILHNLSPKQLSEYDKIINGDTNEWDLFYYVTGRKEPPQEIAETSVFPIIKKFISESEGFKRYN